MHAGTLAENIRQYSEIWTEIRVVDADGDYLIKQKKPVVNVIQSPRKIPTILLDVGTDDTVTPINGDELADKLLANNPKARIYIRYQCTEDEFISSGERGYIVPVEDTWIGLDEAVLYAVKEHANFKEIMSKTNADAEENDDTPDNVNNVENNASTAFPIHRKTIIVDTPAGSNFNEDEPTFEEEEFTGIIQNDADTGNVVDEDDDDSFDLSVLTELLGDIDLNALVDEDKIDGNSVDNAREVFTEENKTAEPKKDRGDILLENALRELNLDVVVDNEDENNDVLDLDAQNDGGAESNSNELLTAGINDSTNGTMTGTSNSDTNVTVPEETVLVERPRKHLKIKKELIQQNMLSDNILPSDDVSDNDFDIFDLDDFEDNSSTVVDVSVGTTPNISSDFDVDFDFGTPVPSPQQQVMPQKQPLPQINNAVAPLPNTFPSQQIPVHPTAMYPQQQPSYVQSL